MSVDSTEIPAPTFALTVSEIWVNAPVLAGVREVIWLDSLARPILGGSNLKILKTDFKKSGEEKRFDGSEKSLGGSALKSSDLQSILVKSNSPAPTIILLDELIGPNTHRVVPSVALTLWSIKFSNGQSKLPPPNWIERLIGSGEPSSHWTYGTPSVSVITACWEVSIEAKMFWIKSGGREETADPEREMERRRRKIRKVVYESQYSKRMKCSISQNDSSYPTHQYRRVRSSKSLGSRFHCWWRKWRC